MNSVLAFLRSCRLNSPQPPNRLNRKERRERKGKPMKDLQSLCAQVRQTAYDIHLYHGHGRLEKVYENALAHRLRKARFEMRKFVWSQDAARRKIKPAS